MMMNNNIDDDKDNKSDENEEGEYIDIWKYFTDLTYEQGDEALNETANKYRDKDPDSSVEEIRNKAFNKLQSVYQSVPKCIYGFYKKNGCTSEKPYTSKDYENRKTVERG